MIETTRPISRTAARDALAERHLVHRVFIAMLIVIPLSAGFFALLVFTATRMGGVPSGVPVLMGAGIGVLSGVFFGMWAGVVASVDEIEHTELAPVPERAENDAATA